ncbi:MAG TPA: hypothetical protein VFJ19_17075 [Nocardioidaceae bacterium]|nr:hypothetical protein [Nocardioidaceae bacterium]
MSTDWTAWLGPAADDLTDEQRERFEAEAEAAIERIGDDPDLQPERDAALAAIVAYLLEETSIEQVGAERTATADAARYASLAAQQVARMAVQDGMSEVAAARAARLDRMTVRRVLGK